MEHPTDRMLAIVIIDVLIGAGLLAGWYIWFARSNRHRSMIIVQGIRAAVVGHGEITGFHWLGPSRFYVQLKLAPHLFRQAAVMVQMVPREMPVSWLWSRLRKKRETLTFEADLDCPPNFNLEVHNHRWRGQASRRFPGQKSCVYEQCGPFLLTTRSDWQRDIAAMMTALVASRECDFLNVTFRRQSPHLSAMVPLQSFFGAAEADIVDVLTELAATASTASF